LKDKGIAFCPGPAASTSTGATPAVIPAAAAALTAMNWLRETDIGDPVSGRAPPRPCLEAASVGKRVALLETQFEHAGT
jgi:hypothetical protein